MALNGALKPAQQLEVDGLVGDSGVIDRIAPHQRIAVPHWVASREGCLVGVYSSLAPRAKVESVINKYIAAPKRPAADIGGGAIGRRNSTSGPTFLEEVAAVDEVAEVLEADREDVRYVSVGSSILTGFIGLHARKAASIETFAGRFGMLHTYTEGFVSKNRLMDTATWRKHYSTLPEHIQKENKDNGTDVFEPLTYWQAFSRFAYLTLRLALQLETPPTGSNLPHSAEDWQFFEGFLKPSPKRSWFPASQPNVVAGGGEAPFLSLDSLTALRAKFCVVLNELQDLGDVKLELRWEKSPPALEFRVAGLVSVIAAQLLMAASQRENFVLCKECHRAFRPWDQPLTGNFDLYCEDCQQDGAPQRNAMRRYRATAKYRDTYQRTRLKKAQNLSGVPVRTSPRVTV